MVLRIGVKGRHIDQLLVGCAPHRMVHRDQVPRAGHRRHLPIMEHPAVQSTAASLLRLALSICKAFGGPGGRLGRKARTRDGAATDPWRERPDALDYFPELNPRHSTPKHERPLPFQRHCEKARSRYGPRSDIGAAASL